MGLKGPIPKRTEQLRRNNAKPVQNAASLSEGFEPWEADDDWHPVAIRVYEAACNSGQRVFYEESDWALLWNLCENMSRDLKPQVIGVHPETGKVMRAKQSIRGTTLNAYTRIMQDLMLTEAARRRARVELVRGYADTETDRQGAMVVDMKRRLNGGAFAVGQ